MGQNPLIVIELCLGILTLVILILFGFLISMIIQIKRTAREAERAMKDFNPLISKIKETTDHINQISEQISLGVTTTANAVRAVENTVRNVSQASSFLSAKNLGKKILASSIWVGVKAGFEVLKNRLFSRRK